MVKSDERLARIEEIQNSIKECLDDLKPRIETVCAEVTRHSEQITYLHKELNSVCAKINQLSTRQWAFVISLTVTILSALIAYVLR